MASNRGPYRVVQAGGRRKTVRAAGGLVTALDPVLRKRGGVWVSAQASDEPRLTDVADLDGAYDLALVSLKRNLQHAFYSDVSNGVLWPLLHSFPPTVRFSEAPWDAYQTANQKFADTIIEKSDDSVAIWIQDYHLMLVPQLIRSKRPHAKIGWFCHIPWPSPDLFAILPWRREVLEGLLNSDLLGFHTEAYVRNFLYCAQALTDAEVNLKKCTVKHNGRIVQVACLPIGVPYREIDTLVREGDLMSDAAQLKSVIGHRRMILGVDRLDYTKGIPERMLGFRRLLETRPSIREDAVLVQVMVPSRTDVEAYARLKSEVDRLVGDINGRFGRTGRVAVHYLYQSLDLKSLYAHYLAADVALVTPLRDGMNLVAQEYVAARADHKGALVLSEFAGAATYLKAALQINPYDVNSIADALSTALTMPADETRRRMVRMRNSVRRLDVHEWADKFLKKLNASHD